MKKFYVALLMVSVLVAGLWIMAEPATVAETLASESVQPAAEQVDLGRLAAQDQLLGENQLDSFLLASSCGTPTCIFPNCQPGKGCRDKCRQAYNTCLTYCDAITCRCLARECLQCCG